MPDTSAARKAIRAAYDKRRDVNGGLSGAELKLLAAAGLIRLEPGEELPWPEDDPTWIEHADAGLANALEACGELRTAIIAAQAEVAKLRSGQPAVEEPVAAADATATVARLRDELLEAVNAIVPGLDPVRAFAMGGMHMTAVRGLAAVEVALRPHRRSFQPAHGPLGGCHGKHFCVGCSQDIDHSTWYVAWPCPPYQAILAALTGKAAAGA